MRIMVSVTLYGGVAVGWRIVVKIRLTQLDDKRSIITLLEANVSVSRRITPWHVKLYHFLKEYLRSDGKKDRKLDLSTS